MGSDAEDPHFFLYAIFQSIMRSGSFLFSLSLSFSLFFIILFMPGIIKKD
jgi:hypothetical protein